MAIEVIPELGVELPKGTQYIDLLERANAACNTVHLLEKDGIEIPPPTEEDRAVASALAHAYAEDPEKASKSLSKLPQPQTPASLLMVKGILDEFGGVVVESSVRVRNLVTNKLLLETENPDARIRLRALEMLGKISDVGLFSDKSEITVTHQSSDELKEKLREKLSKLVHPDEPIEDAVYVDEEDDEIDVDAALGLSYDD